MNPHLVIVLLPGTLKAMLPLCARDLEAMLHFEANLVLFASEGFLCYFAC
jgi:hypothetical protein